jgi:hypothetical protein
LFIVDDLVAIAMFALMGKLAHDVITEKPNHDDDSSFSTYTFSSTHRDPYDVFSTSLNRSGEEPYVAMPNLPSIHSPSRRYRFDKYTGEWDEPD